MDLNVISYGNPTKEQYDLIHKQGLVDDLFENFKQEIFPLNNSELTKEELNEISECLKTIALPENESYLKRYKAYDKSLIQTIVSFFKKEGIDVENLCIDIVEDIQSLIYKIKYFYQRPRPYQLAHYHKLKLFPYKSTTALSPSFPSGHTCEAVVILNVIGNKYPAYYNQCKEMIDDIAYSRIYLGIHYSSDNDFAKKVGKAILKHENFTKKYKI